MNDAGLRVGLLVAAIALAAAAAVADPNTASELPLAVAAGVALAAFATLSVVGQTRFARAPFVPPVTDPLVALRQAFRSGPLGRQRVVGAILELQREAFGRTGSAAPGGAGPRPEELPPPEFRAWVAAQLDELERRT